MKLGGSNDGDGGISMVMVIIGRVVIGMVVEVGMQVGGSNDGDGGTGGVVIVVMVVVGAAYDKGIGHDGDGGGDCVCCGHGGAGIGGDSGVSCDDCGSDGGDSSKSYKQDCIGTKGLLK